jgi:hypothetical protein
LVACGGAWADETLQPQFQPPTPPRFLYIHCATPVDDGPCGLDPAMQRLNVDPRFDRPTVAPDPHDRPELTPAR